MFSRNRDFINLMDNLSKLKEKCTDLHAKVILTKTN